MPPELSATTIERWAAAVGSEGRRGAEGAKRHPREDQRVRLEEPDAARGREATDGTDAEGLTVERPSAGRGAGEPPS